jgi:hypothetical protein
MAGNYNYTTKMSRNQFYDQYAPLSAWARYQQANFPGSYKESNFYSNPTYRATMVNGANGGNRRFHDDFNQAYGRYTNLFDSRVAAKAAAKKQIADQKATAERLMIQQEQRIRRINTNAAATRGSLQILGQEQPMAPTAQLAEKKKGTRGVRQTATNISRGSSRSRGTNLSI